MYCRFVKNSYKTDGYMFIKFNNNCKYYVDLCINRAQPKWHIIAFMFLMFTRCLNPIPSAISLLPYKTYINIKHWLFQRAQIEDMEDDVDLSHYMDIDDEMECKSAASWNPKFDFEAGGRDTKESSDLKPSSTLRIFSSSPLFIVGLFIGRSGAKSK